MKKVFLFAALAFSLNGFAQKVSGKIGLKKGQKLEIVTETSGSSTQEVMGQTMESTSKSTLTEVYDVEDAGGSGATIEHKVKRFQMSGEAMGRSQTFDSENAEDRKGEIGQMLDKKLLKNKYTMVIDPFGKVVSVKLDDDNPAGKKKDDEDSMAEMMAQQMGASVAIPKAGDPSMFSILPASREVGAGDNWSDSSNMDGIKLKRTYSVKSITNNDIILDVVSERKMEKTIQIMGTEASVNSTDKGTGTITIDRATGLLKTMTTATKTEGTVEAQGMTIPVTGNNTVTVTVKAG